MASVLVTGGAGFIGSHFVRDWLDESPTDTMIVLDALTYAANRRNLQGVEPITFIHGDISDIALVEDLLRSNRIDIVVNFAAESHNSAGVTRPMSFFETNVLGTVHLLEAVRKVGIGRFHHVSSSEVYGDVPIDVDDPFEEDAPYRPSSPYSASKAAADHAVRAYASMYSIPTTISVSCNNYGPHQFPEKIIPLFTTNAVQGHHLPLYSSSANLREYMHVRDHCAAIRCILQNGRPGETFHVGSGVEVTIEEIADLVLQELDLPASLKTLVPDRPMHARRHALNSSKIRSHLGWVHKIDFYEGLRDTIRWYVNNREWWSESIARREINEQEWR